MGMMIDPSSLDPNFNKSAKTNSLPEDIFQLKSKIDNIQSENFEVNEQLIELMKKNSELSKVIHSLKSEIKSLKKQKFNEKKQDSRPKKTFSNEEKKILLLLSKAGKATSGQIIRALKYDLPIAEYCLKRLCENDMIFFSTVVNQESAYYLGQEGRRYLTENEHFGSSHKRL